MKCLKMPKHIFFRKKIWALRMCIFWSGHFPTFGNRVMDKYRGSTGIKVIKLLVMCLSSCLNKWAGENKYQGNILSYLTTIYGNKFT